MSSYKSCFKAWLVPWPMALNPKQLKELGAPLAPEGESVVHRPPLLWGVRDKIWNILSRQVLLEEITLIIYNLNHKVKGGKLNSNMKRS